MQEISNFEVEGLADLDKALEQVGYQIGLKVMRAAGRKAMKPVEVAMIAGANEATGDLKASINTTSSKPKSSRNGVTVFTNVGPGRKKAAKSQGGRTLSRVNAKAIAQEYGTARQKAEPFMRPALANNAQKVLGIYITELSKGIEAAVRKLAK